MFRLLSFFSFILPLFCSLVQASPNDLSNNVTNKTHIQISQNSSFSEITHLPNINSNEGWDLALEKNGIQIFTRKWPGSDFVAVKTVQVIQSSLTSIVANLLDINNFPEWVKDMKEARLLVDFNHQSQRAIYMHMDMPWPLQDRDIVVQQTLSQDPESFTVTINEEKRTDLFPEIPGIVRVPSVNSQFVLTPLAEGGVRMIWQGHNEPGGIIPPFLVNWLIDHVFYDSSLNMRTRFEAEEFQISEQPLSLTPSNHVSSKVLQVINPTW